MTTTTTSLLDQYAEHVLGNYGAPSLALERGEGSYVWDVEGQRYLDFATGIAVNALGHCHPVWVKRVQEQAATLVHTCNLFAVPGQAKLAEKLNAVAGPGKCFFCNSGAEANEALIKLARLFGREKAGGEEGKIYKVITAENAFHGRTFGGMGATPQEKIQGGFRPMLPGFAHAKLNNLESFAAAIDDHTAAVLLETVQGEGGVNPATPEFLQGLRQLCTERNVLLLIDEVQCGIGRTGRFFAYQEAGIEPDAIGMAKGLGAGFPIGALWIANAYAPLFKPGSHGTTFGGNPLASAAALAVLEVIEADNLLEQVTLQSACLMARLNNLMTSHAGVVRAIRGKGYMIGIALEDSQDHIAVVAALRKNGLLTAPAGGKVVRLLPPLTASMNELNEAAEIVETTLRD